MVAWDGRSRWQPDSGQFLFNFEAARVVRGARQVAALSTKRRPKDERGSAAPPASAEEWCDLAMELEHESPVEAQAPIAMRSRRDPGSVMAHINLGCLLHAAGDT